MKGNVTLETRRKTGIRILTCYQTTGRHRKTDGKRKRTPVLHDWKHFGKHDGSFSEILVEDARLVLVGRVADQSRLKHNGNKSLKHFVA